MVAIHFAEVPIYRRLHSLEYLSHTLVSCDHSSISCRACAFTHPHMPILYSTYLSSDILNQYRDYPIEELITSQTVH